MNNFKLGFGLMRLPKKDGRIDVEQVKKMVDLFIEAGGTYFDTAFAYEGSEEAVREALIERYPRDSFTLATKLICSSDINDEQSAKDEFYTSLRRTNARYFDYYLLHAIQRSNYEKYDRFHLWDFVEDLKKQGLVKHYGISFHGDLELLEELLIKHPGIEFVQLQINYADWENPGVNSKANYELARKYGKDVIVMEPIKGGILANPIDDVKKILKDANPEVSYSSWALRFVNELDGLISILSGMSSIEQMEDNLKTMVNCKPLSEDEKKTIELAQKAINEFKAISCTACHYCTKGCPMNIPIPDIFTVYNRKKDSPEFRTKREYVNVTINKGKASDCIKCGQCESSCPQHLKIIELLDECKIFE